MLRAPRYAKRPWWKELNFGRPADVVQREILGGEPVVRTLPLVGMYVLPYSLSRLQQWSTTRRHQSS